MKLDLGCGGGKVDPSFIGVDHSPDAHPDILYDLLDLPWPWPDSSIEEIYAGNFIEHLPTTCVTCSKTRRDPLIQFFEECHRVLLPGGVLTVKFPSCTSEQAFQDPTHRRFLTFRMMLYFSAEGRKFMGLSHYDIHCDLVVEEHRNEIAEEYGKMEREELTKLMHGQWNVNLMEIVKMRAVK